MGCGGAADNPCHAGEGQPYWVTWYVDPFCMLHHGKLLRAVLMQNSKRSDAPLWVAVERSQCANDVRPQPLQSGREEVG